MRSPSSTNISSVRTPKSGSSTPSIFCIGRDVRPTLRPDDPLPGGDTPVDVDGLDRVRVLEHEFGVSLGQRGDRLVRCGPPPRVRRRVAGVGQHEVTSADSPDDEAGQQRPSALPGSGNPFAPGRGSIVARRRVSASRSGSWRREVTPSFAKALRRWYSMVLMLTTSSSAISRLLRPPPPAGRRPAPATSGPAGPVRSARSGFRPDAASSLAHRSA